MTHTLIMRFLERHVPVGNSISSTVEPSTVPKRLHSPKWKPVFGGRCLWPRKRRSTSRGS